MLSRRRAECAVFAVLVALSRYLFRSHLLYDLDSVNFALGVARFDPTVHQPHPPGYFLYIYLARLVNSFVHDPNSALVLISIAASCGAVVMIYLLAFDWFGDKAARFAALLFLFSPLTWFHGIVGLIYMLEGFLSAVAGYLCWQVSKGRKAFAIPAAATLALGAGIRPSFALFLAPLFLFSLRGLSVKRICSALSALILAVLAWFVPMVEVSGGWVKYFTALSALWHIAGGRETVFNSSPFTSLARMLAIFLIYVVCFGSAVLLSGNAFRREPKDHARQRLFTLFWIAPGLLFFAFIFFRFVNSGYLLVVSPPVFAWVSLWVSEWYSGLRIAQRHKFAAVALFATINVVVFLVTPIYCSYRSVREFEANMLSIRQAVPGIASPEHTVIIGFDSHFLGYRHAGYYLPQYVTVLFPKLPTAGGRRIAMMQNRDTHLLDRVDTARFTNFLLFPLPSDEKAYMDYATKVKAMFPQADLRTVHVGNRAFVTGPISDLRFLFPEETNSPKVYTARHGETPGVYSR
jgi:4-amino-4-deoxy-L-arabinose transferase-like glycosyltransferase